MWSLDINEKNGMKVITGDSDSLFVVWEDSTKEDNDKNFLEKQEKIIALNSIELLKNAGIYCSEFEEELEVIIFRFKNRPTLQQGVNEAQENSLSRKGPFSL